MKAKAGMIVTEMSGSLGGHTFQNSKGGFQIRNKPIPRGNPSASQQAIRSINPVLQRGWQALTKAQQEIWNAYAVTHNICNKSGDPHPLSGHDLWMKYQYGFKSKGLPFISYPSLHGPPYLGPETIINGSFTSGLNWIGYDGANFVNDMANFVQTNFSFIGQFKQLSISTNYRVTFDIFNCPAGGKLHFRSFGGITAFIAPYDIPVTISNGHYIWDATSSLLNVVYFIYSAVGTNSFSLDNLSIKKSF